MRATPVLLIAFFGCCSPAQETAGLHGVVVNAATGEPMSRVQVHLTIRAPGDGEPLPGYVAGTDEVGRFSLSPIPPGTYMVRPERRGYYLAPPKGEPAARPMATLKPGQQARDYRLEMLPQAVISGRLLNEDGEPVRHAHIELEPAEGDRDLLYFLKIYGASADDRGEYGISAPAGSYRVRADLFDFLDDEIRTDGSLPVSYAPTWHPNATSSGRARVVRAEAGAETTGVDIQLRPVRLSIGGKATGAPAGVTVTVSLECLVNRGSFWTDVKPEADGGFAFGRLQPGRCFVFAHSSSGGREMRSAVVEMHLERDPVEELELALKPGSDISGALEMADKEEAANRVVRLEPLDEFMGRTYTSAAGRDGAFDVKAVAPGRYRLSVRPLPEDGYVKAASLDGAAVERGILDLRAGAGSFKLKIATGKGAARLSGKVEHPSGRASAVATVYLVPDGDEKLEEAIHTLTGSDGAYSFRDVPPGKYRLFALEGYDEPEGPQVLARAEEVELKEGDRISKNLKLLAKEAADGKSR